MRTYDVLDEATIAGTPVEVFAALEDEVVGRSHWWRPWLALALDDPSVGLAVGATMSAWISETGHPERPLSTLRMRARFTRLDPGHVVAHSLTGPFQGTGEWRLESVDDRRTRVAFRWQMHPTGLMRVWSRLVDVPRHHSAVMRKGLAALADYVVERRGPAVR